MRRPTNPKHRAWVFTWNNYTDEDVETATAVCNEASFAVFGFETGECGTPHLQGYVRFKNPRAFSTVRTDLLGAHVEPARGSAQSNFEYCSKGGDYRQFGNMPAGQGKRSDLSRFRKEVAEMKCAPSKEALLTNHTTVYAKYQRFTREVIDHYHPPQKIDGNLSNMWITGPASTGKTSMLYRSAEEQGLSVYVKNCNKWWDGYNDEDVVIIDDFPKDFKFLIQYLKIWADRYVFRGEIKGASRAMRPKRIWITSNHKPGDCPDIDPGDLDAILSRFRVYEKLSLQSEPVEDTSGPAKK